MSRFLVIEGLIGVGKTSLCRILEREWGARLMLEPMDDNPFLPFFYGDPARYAFPTQMSYMAARYAQQQRAQQELVRQEDLFSRLLISDYLFEKDRLFAEMTLRDHELDLYQRITGLLPDVAPTPDLVIFLDADIELILDRIRRRSIGFEQKIPRSYLEDLHGRYSDLWQRYSRSPLLTLRTDRLNYVDDPRDRATVLQTIRHALDGALPPPPDLFHRAAPQEP